MCLDETVDVVAAAGSKGAAGDCDSPVRIVAVGDDDGGGAEPMDQND